jgi:hypothetical protein
MQAALHQAQGTQLAVLIAALALVAFWRTVIKWVVILVATTMIAALGYGAILIWQDMHHHIAR